LRGFGCELVVNIVQQPLHRGPLAVGESARGAENAAVLAAADDIGRDSDLAEQPFQSEFPPHDADGTGDCSRIGENAIGPHGDVVASASGDVSHADDEGFFAPVPADAT
jgi:hypothetical protein